MLSPSHRAVLVVKPWNVCGDLFFLAVVMYANCFKRVGEHNKIRPTHILTRANYVMKADFRYKIELCHQDKGTVFF